MKDIPGYEGLYAVTTDGKVWSHPKKWKSGKNGVRNQRHKGRWLRPQRHSGGYLFVGLSLNNKPQRMYIHRAVSLAYIPNPNKKPEVNHKDSNKKNNRLENLEWATRIENSNHAKENNLYTGANNPSIGSKHPDTHLTKIDVLVIRQLYSVGTTQRRLCKRYGLSGSAMSSLCRGTTWKHLPVFVKLCKRRGRKPKRK